MSDAVPPIVVGFDASDGADAALNWAMAEGARTGTPVVVVYAFDWPTSSAIAGLAPTAWPDHGAHDEADRVLAAALSKARESHSGVPVAGAVVPGAASAVLVQRSRGARLVVLGGRGAGGFADQLIGSTSIGVSAHAHCPVVVVRGSEPAPGAPVVVGVDDSDYAQLAAEFAFAAAASRGTSLRVIRSWEPPSARWRPSGYNPDAQIAAQHEETAEFVAAWRDKYPRVTASIHVVAGRPAEALIEASRGAQLAVVGSRGRGGFRGLLLGSVSQQLLYHAECPVAIVRSLPD
ncbi:universal stress protein [Phytohabitans sp. ZYX-F-186]|uniref:Universal stress protein n=1 Tax=Phytohabitans maris TaxID=3071409 RepID=A0ABU0ZWN8_9ACTN|nr:universal stress protein [Phytohabitans sp. ZYX-F-186]MDQ7910734.1 universal stress protein [Phytohabitans sp. ZYX-F-186]